MPIPPNNSQMLISGNMNCAQSGGSCAMQNPTNGHTFFDNEIPDAIQTTT